jgi:GxxExxY protein
MNRHPEPSTECDQIAKKIVQAIFDVHMALGPGLLESIYEECLSRDLVEAGLRVSRQTPMPVIYKEKLMDLGSRLDLLVEDQIIIEIKSSDSLAPIHYAQILSYLKLSNLKLGFLVNFNTLKIKNGLHRIIRSS